MANTVFISHAAADIELVRKVEQHVRPLEIQAYAYEDDPQGGGSVATKLEERIRRSDVLVVLLTRNSQHRPSVHAEVGIARALGKPIIPVVEVGVDPLQFVFLQGIEWVALDVAKLDETLLGVQLSLKRLKDLAKSNALVIAGILLVLTVIFFLAAQQRSE